MMKHRLLSNDWVQWQQVKEDDDTLTDILQRFLRETHNNRVEYLLDFNEDEAS